MKFSLNYKYYVIETSENDILIELGIDSTLNHRGIYSAKTNAIFMDEEGDLGHACGVGKDESSALQMCLRELKEVYPNLNEYNMSKYKRFGKIDFSSIKEIDLPYKITFEIIHNREVSCYFKKEGEQLLVLTDKDKFYLPVKDSIVNTLKKNIKRLKDSSLNNFTKDYLKNNNFYPLFEDLTF